MRNSTTQQKAISENVANKIACLLCSNCASEKLLVGSVSMSQYASDGTGTFAVLAHGEMAVVDDIAPGHSEMVSLMMKYACLDCHSISKFLISGHEGGGIVAINGKGEES